MSIDLRHRYKRDDKISMLDKKINRYSKPLTVPYITENNYYEVIVEKMALNGHYINKGYMSMMIDSGTTFSHFPTLYM